MEEKFTIKCPKCEEVISLDQALSKELKDDWQKDLEKKLDVEKDRIEKEVKIKAAEHYSSEIKQMQKLLEDKSKTIDNFRDQELKLRQEKNSIEERSKNIEIELQRKLDDEKKVIRDNIQKEIFESNKWKFAEKDKVISDLKKQMDEMQRKVDQGSQQSQGEVVELELENLLKTSFPFDTIEPVGKGIHGADIVQIVCNKFGQKCGKIIWESKNTKAWSPGWLSKLKEDSHTEKADIPVIVSTVTPDKIKSFGWQDGVWITKFEYIIGLATALRTNLIEIRQAKLSVVNKNEKMEFLYNYLTGNEFKQRVQAIADAFITMQEDLASEKRAYERIWARREKLLTRAVNSTLGMRGDLEGLIGPNLPAIDNFELTSGEIINEEVATGVESKDSDPPLEIEKISISTSLVKDQREEQDSTNSIPSLF